jgi:hypothetical protein
MKKDVANYIQGCAKCQRHKVNTRPMCTPLVPIPKEDMAPFDVIAVDFITKLPVLSGYDTILILQTTTIQRHEFSYPARKKY